MSDALDACPICKFVPRSQAWIRTPAVAAHLGCSVKQIERMVAAGELRGIRLTRQLRIAHESLDEYVRRRDTMDES